MTEAEWLGGEDGEPMMRFLAGHPSETDRKLRLFAVACHRQARSSYPLLEAELEAVERYADGLVGREDLLAAHHAHYRHLFPHDPDSAFGLVLDAGEYAYSEATRTGEARAAAARLLRDVFGNPFRPAALDPSCVTPAALTLARAAYDERDLQNHGELDPVRLAVLADALEEAGAGGDLLAHLRGPGPHVRGCWAVDLCLGKS